MILQLRPKRLIVCVLSYLLKPHDASWKDGIVALEAGVFCLVSVFCFASSPRYVTGSGLGTLTDVMKREPTLFKETGDIGTDSTPCFSAHEVYSCIR